MHKIIPFLALTIALMPASAAERLQTTNLTYRGAFRLPDSPGMPDNVNWTWNAWASAMAFYPEGDPSGPDDGYPGSIFGVGHDHTQYVSEIGIPVPVISPSTNLNDLNTAQTLQPFANIKPSSFEGMELPRVGLAYLPAQGAQTSGKLYFAWAPHMGETETNPSHGWCDLTLSNPQTRAAWRIGDYWNYVTGDYLFPIPRAWADLYTPGKYLATGRMRDGGQGAEGPSIFAIGPWNDGNPPTNGATLSATPLLLYQNAYQENPTAMTGYQHSDEWSGCAWLSAGQASAVVFVGTKGLGNCWYGYADGTVYPDESEGERGWWSTAFEGQMLFYDSDELGQAALGQRTPHSVQPYATLNIDNRLYNVTSTQQRSHLGAAAFDDANGLLYVFEPRADEEKSIVHVWHVSSASSPTNPPAAPSTVSASDGVFRGKVRVAWNAPSGASSYEVWRNSAPSSAAANKIATATSLYHDDTNVTAEVLYYYWVKAKNSLGTSDFSAADSGFACAAQAGSVINDYSGDGCSDMAVFDGDAGTWYIAWLDGTIIASGFGWGWPGAWPVPGDYDGDGLADLAVFDQNTGWWFATTLDNQLLAWAFPWGWPGARPVPGDYDGDGISDCAVFDRNTGWWFIASLAGEQGSGFGGQNERKPKTDHRSPITAALRVIAWAFPWGWPGAWPVSGDYDGDGLSDLAVFDQNSGYWYATTLTGERLAWEFAWGWPGAWPVSGDYDGDGLSDCAVFDQNTGWWYVAALSSKFTVQSSQLEDETHNTDNRKPNTSSPAIVSPNTDHRSPITGAPRVIAWAFQWGWPGAWPVSGDYDGDGLSDCAVFDQNTGWWFIVTLEGEILAWAFPWGWPGATPVGWR